MKADKLDRCPYLLWNVRGRRWQCELDNEKGFIWCHYQSHRKCRLWEKEFFKTVSAYMKEVGK